MEKNNLLVISGLAIGGLVGGIPGAIVGGVIGALLKEIYCPLCRGMMKFVNGWWRCERCGYVKK